MTEMGEEEDGDDNDDGCTGNVGGGGSLPLAMLGDVVTAAAMASRNLYSLLDGDDGRGGKEGGATCVRIKKNSGIMVDDDGGCYGYLLKSHFLIR